MTDGKNLMLSIKNLTYSVDRGKKKIIDNLDLEIERGRFAGLIGPNGAGKTTLLKCINRIYEADSGTVMIDGKDIKRMSVKELAKYVALMHQNTEINFPFSSYDIVAMGRYPYIGAFSGESVYDREIINNCMEYTNTLKYRDRIITTLSGGERQRVMFARTMAQDTGLILLDEPTASLDISYEKQLFGYASGLCNKGRTVIAAVHDLKLAAKYCSILILMKEGRIIDAGNPQDVLTSKNLSRAYGVNALVYKNRISGQMDYFIYDKQKSHITESTDEDNNNHTAVFDRKNSELRIQNSADKNLADGIITGVQLKNLLKKQTNIEELYKGNRQSGNAPYDASEYGQPGNEAGNRKTENTTEYSQPGKETVNGDASEYGQPGNEPELVSRIHIVGGGGSASHVIRELFVMGKTVTAGVFAHGDSDLATANVFGIDTAQCEPFSDIDNRAYNENVNLIKNADMAILCNIPFGHQNIKNLEALKYAKKLVIIEDDNPASRDFTGGLALSVYNELASKALIIDSSKLHEILSL